MTGWRNQQALKMRLVVGILCAVSGGSTATAGAQTPAAPLDPGGPAGYEYALPSGDALDQTGAAPPDGGPGAPPGAARGSGQPTVPGADPRLFGVGVDPAGERPDGRSEGPLEGSTQRPGQDAGSAREPSRQSEAAASRWEALSQDGGGSPLWLLSAVAVAVVGAAGALAFALRRPRVSGPAA